MYNNNYNILTITVIITCIALVKKKFDFELL